MRRMAGRPRLLPMIPPDPGASGHCALRASARQLQTTGGQVDLVAPGRHPAGSTPTL